MSESNTESRSITVTISPPALAALSAALRRQGEMVARVSEGLESQRQAVQTISAGMREQVQAVASVSAKMGADLEALKRNFARLHFRLPLHRPPRRFAAPRSRESRGTRRRRTAGTGRARLSRDDPSGEPEPPGTRRRQGDVAGLDKAAAA